MDLQLYEKYKNVLFPKESHEKVLDMFAEIIEQDTGMIKVFKYIGEHERKFENAAEPAGITINDLINDIEVTRLVKKKKTSRNFTYEQAKTNLHRKTAERIVDKLSVMSLIYFKPVKPYKFIYLTERGKQVLIRIIEIKRLKKEMKQNG